MFEQLAHIFSKISLAHLNILFLLGLALFGGTIGGRLFQKLRIPQVVGYIAIGLALGESGLKIVSQDVIRMLQPFNYFALGLIGVMVGGKLKRNIFSRYGRQLITILLCEGIAPFLFVALSVGIVGSFFLDWKLSWALGLLFGAIASATDPATTTEVFREYRTRGPLTATITGIIALDDGLALMLFAVASSIAGSLSGHMHTGFLKTFIHPLYDIGGSVLLGAVGGFLLTKILKKYSENERLLAFSIGTVLLVTGVALAVNVEMLLATMIVGAIVVNFTPSKSRDVFKLMSGFTPPIYVLFFVLIGAKLNFSHMTQLTFLLVGIYLFGTIVGKMIGSQIGTRISASPLPVQRYLSLGLFSQAGVAIGLSILAAQYFPGEVGNTIIVVITTTTFILQLIGPPFTKLAVTKAGEVGLNITEEEYMQETRVADVMDKNPPLIYKNFPLGKILKTFSESANLYYPVVDNDNKLLGIVTVDNLKNIFIETGLSDLLLAVDVMEPSVACATPETPLIKAKELLEKHNLEFLPVLKGDGVVVGFIERRILNKIISTKVIELQKQADAV